MTAVIDKWFTPIAAHKDKEKDPAGRVYNQTKMALLEASILNATEDPFPLLVMTADFSTKLFPTKIFQGLGMSPYSLEFLPFKML